MASNFRRVITELWASFGEEPPFSDEDVVELKSDEITLRIEEFLDRRLLVSAEIGPISQDRMRGAEQTRAVLADNLGLLMSRRGCVHLKPDASDPPILMVSGMHSYDDRVRDLSQLIEDILFLHQWHAETLRDPASASKPAFSPDLQERSHVVFRQ